MGEAVLSDCGRYRYALWRDVPQSWMREGGDCVLFVMLNPSTADADQDDPTIRRCWDFARRWNYGKLAVGNLYALRATDPRELAAAIDPIGPENDRHLADLAEDADLIIAAWGATPHPDPQRIEQVLSILGTSGPGSVMCLGATKAGHPRHPVRLAARTELEALVQ